MSALLSLATQLCQNKKLLLILFEVLVLWSVATVWANMSSLPAKVAQHETRLTTLEFEKATQSEQLKAINNSLTRIETSVGETRRDVSELKTTLIRR
jgi:uncharacterized coiled-coil protein SlyX